MQTECLAAWMQTEQIRNDQAAMLRDDVLAWMKKTKCAVRSVCRTIPLATVREQLY